MDVDGKSGADVKRDHGDEQEEKEEGFKVVVVSGLTKNVQRAHLMEIFEVYGKVVGLDLPLFKVCKSRLPVIRERDSFPLKWIIHFVKGYADVAAGLNRGKAALEFEKPSQAEKAIKHMDGGQLDGAFLTVQVSFPSS